MSEAISKAVNPVTEQEREKKIAEIRETLENVTPGDWYAQQRYANLWSIEVKQDGRYPITIANVTTTLLEVGIHDEHIKYNAQLFAKATKWLRFLLSELERLEREYAEERAAHNAHVAELCELEKENRKLREERDAAVEGYQQQVKYAGELMTKLVSAQQELNMYKSSSEVFYERLKKEAEQRDKLIEGLRTILNYASEDGVHWKLDRCYTTARDILKEVGVLSK